MEEVSAAADGGPGWAPEQYLRTVYALLKSPYNAVVLRELKVAVGKGGAGAVQAMVQAGLLGVRPVSGACLHAPLIFLRWQC